MPFIPDDILDEALKAEVEDLQVLLGYATFLQREYVEPDASQIAAVLQISLDETQDVLNRLSSKGWLKRVKDYGEIIGKKDEFGLN